ncbi:uncharacterized protein LOC106170676 [Lingula anatina]|uniref:Uncharacterized protein LOC106170676 n=1 Tax=Lingula anatina TaxID=7574 RepID=A0A1S3J6T1_LINAN|nr:uncharacterized protein LOC106170676 [Lingula anatina]|eukprot:XP_013406100.1 uncharacterized protein LOC106170676 [Lingula anatina]
MEFGLGNPLTSWELKTILGGIRRHKGDQGNQKLPLLPEHLYKLHGTFNLSNLQDLQQWAACLCAFFGLLRVSNVTVKSQSEPGHSLCRKDFSVMGEGGILRIAKSKTNQYGHPPHTVVLPYIAGSALCPITTLLKFLGAQLAAPDTPLFSYTDEKGNLSVLTQSMFRRRLIQALKDIGLSSATYNTHSLHRGGATWLMSVGTPLAMVKAMGDWKSDAVYEYIKPSTVMKLDVVTSAVQKL